MVAILNAMAGRPKMTLRVAGSTPARYSEARYSRRGLRFSGWRRTPCWAASIWFLAFSLNRLTISGLVPTIWMARISVLMGLIVSLVGSDDAVPGLRPLAGALGGASPSGVASFTGMVHPSSGD